MPLTWLPNALTIARCCLAAFVAWLILSEPAQSLWPLIAFILVALTDFVDGLAARRLNAVSAFGAFLDPVADKLLVGFSLIALSALSGWPWILIIPTGLIILRDVIATILRLFPKIEMPVSRLAKWKTAIEMIGISALLVAGPAQSTIIWQSGIVIVWAAAALSIYTLGLYLGSSLTKEERPH